MKCIDVFALHVYFTCTLEIGIDNILMTMRILIMFWTKSFEQEGTEQEIWIITILTFGVDYLLKWKLINKNTAT